MAQKSDQELLQGLVVGRSGTVTEMSVAQSFFNALDDEFRGAGFNEQLDNPKWPKPLAGISRPKADVGVTPFHIWFGIFLATTVGAWAIGKVCDFFWAKTKNAFANLKKDYTELCNNSRDDTHPMTIEFESYYDNDSLTILVVAIVIRPADLDRVEELVPQAHHRALAWIESHGVPNGTIQFTIKEGELTEFPKVITT